MGKAKVISLILAFAVFFRLVVINQSFWLDEAISVLAANKFGYRELISEFAKYDFHPPLFYLILKFWGNIFGFSEVAVRLLQEVRMYPIAAFFVALSFLFFIKLLKNQTPKVWALFSVSLLVFMTLDYVPVFILPVFWMIPIFAKKKKEFYLKLGLSFLPLFLMFVFWLPTFTVQLTSGRELSRSLPLWTRVVGSPTLKELALIWVKFIVGRITFFNKFLYSLVILAVSVFFGYTFLNGMKAKMRTLGIWFLAPVFLGFLFSFFVPAFSYFRFLFLLPAFYLIIASGVRSKLAIGILVGINLICLGFYYSNKNNWREEWREAVSFVEINAKNDEIALFEFKEPFAPWEWYSTGSVAAEGAKDKNVQDLVKDKKGVWHFEYLADITDPEKALLKDIAAEGFIEVSQTSFRGVGKVTYLRRS